MSIAVIKNSYCPNPVKTKQNIEKSEFVFAKDVCTAQRLEPDVHYEN